MPANDSIARKIITYLRTNLPDGLGETLYFDALAFRSEKVPALIVTPCPSIAEIRHGGTVDVDTRDLKCYITLFWTGEDRGRNYDEFENMLVAIADTMSNMQGTSTLGTDVLKCTLSAEESLVSFDEETARYAAEFECMITFVR